MSAHGDMLKGLLAKKKGTAAHRAATKEQAKVMQTLAKEVRKMQSQVNTTQITKAAARGT